MLIFQLFYKCSCFVEGWIWNMEGPNLVWEGAYLGMKRAHWGMEKVHLEYKSATRAVLSKAWGPWGGQTWKCCFSTVFLGVLRV